MKVASIDAYSLTIPFRQSFRHAAAERSATQSIWIEARNGDGLMGVGEGCPRGYVTAETMGTAAAFIRDCIQEWRGKCPDPQSICNWVRSHSTRIDANPSAWAAVEIALLDLLARERSVPIESLLGLPRLEGRFTYSAVLGDSGRVVFETQLARYLQSGFRQFKIKLSGDLRRDGFKVRALAAAGISPDLVRADANNLWSRPEQAIEFCKALCFPFHAIEEPLRAGDYEGMRRIAGALGTRIILDESLARSGQLDELPKADGIWVANIRVSKLGGVLRSRDCMHKARERGLGIIVGAHVGETSVLTRAALAVAGTMRGRLLAQEGAFGRHLLAQEITNAPVEFGASGVLDADAFGICDRPGLGFDVVRPNLHLRNLAMRH
jgi:L-alanine-DL-glutamate epimerase-like enolase superfamily enzyme